MLKERKMSVRMETVLRAEQKTLMAVIHFCLERG